MASFRQMLRYGTMLSGFGLALTTPVKAQAQDGAPEAAPPQAQIGVGEIVVTAHRRKENLQQVPIE